MQHRELQTGHALQFAVVDDRVDPEFVLIVVQRYGCALQYVGVELILACLSSLIVYLSSLIDCLSSVIARIFRVRRDERVGYALDMHWICLPSSLFFSPRSSSFPFPSLFHLFLPLSFFPNFICSKPSLIFLYLLFFFFPIYLLPFPSHLLPSHGLEYLSVSVVLFFCCRARLLFQRPPCHLLRQPRH